MPETASSESSQAQLSVESETSSSGESSSSSTASQSTHVSIQSSQTASQAGQPGQSTAQTTAGDQSATGTGQQAAFRLCEGASAQAARSIEQLIAGRGFSARLSSREDGCAELLIEVRPSGSVAPSGRQSTNLSVSAGATGGETPPRINVQIVSENGATQVTIG
jgi:hypothetical protein